MIYLDFSCPPTFALIRIRRQDKSGIRHGKGDTLINPRDALGAVEIAGIDHSRHSSEWRRASGSDIAATRAAASGSCGLPMASAAVGCARSEISGRISGRYELTPPVTSAAG